MNIINKKISACMVAHAFFSLRTGEAEAGRPLRLKALNRVSFRTAGATQRNLVLGRKKLVYKHLQVKICGQVGILCETL